LTYIDSDKAFSELSAGALRDIKYSAIIICFSMAGGIAALMILSRGKGEDLTGIVAPGALFTVASGAVATVSALFQKRVQKGIDTRLME
jgi:hypothetical protein